MLLFTTLVFAGNSLQGPEKRLAKEAGKLLDEQVELLETLTEQNSGTLNAEGVRATGELLRPELEALGFSVSWVEVEGRAGHLVADHPGDGGKRIVLVTHLDTVFEPDSSFQDFDPDGAIARGPGVHDMKGGVVVALGALQALHARGLLEGVNVVFFGCGDEELPADDIAATRGPLIELAKGADVALGFEGWDEDHPGIVTARRGISTWTAEAKGNGGHSSRIFTEAMGYGAAYEAARFVDALREDLPEELLTYNVGLMAAGSTAALSRKGAKATGKKNRVPTTAWLAGDLRYISEEQRDRAAEKMEALAADSLPGTSLELEMHHAYPPMPPTDGNRALHAEVADIHAALGLRSVPEVDPLFRGAADVSFVAPYVDVIDGLGPSGGGDHSPDEYVRLDDLSPATQRAALLLYRLSE